ncbi:hypothetical protein [Amycolatopsis sp. NPDC051102]|uniref:hypothetical protein n=1 Tax=Amycolatopsis sp. NPDC051102 TaxID=3155163 RepID=UPI003426E72E
MSALMPFIDVGGSLVAAAEGAVIASNSLVERREINIWGSRRPVQADMYQVDEAHDGHEILGVRGHTVVSRLSVRTAIEEGQLAAVRERLRGLPHDWYEVFHADHPVNRGCHFPDPWGEVTKLLLTLEDQVPGLTKPPANHNKVSSRRVDKFALNEMHIDGFDGMRVTDGRRTLIWRYFFNLSDGDVRWVAVVPFDPDELDELVPVERTVDRFEQVYAAVDRRIPILLVPTPPRVGGQLHALRLPTTHLLHSEYGKAGDLLAIVNSLT